MTDIFLRPISANNNNITLNDPDFLAFGILKMWNGSQWTNKIMKVYLSGTWQSKVVKMWDGYDWRLIDSG